MQSQAISKTYPGQILIVTLLVLVIIAIIVVSIVSIASRDVLQTVSNERYQLAYNASETKILTVVDKYADSARPLAGLPADFAAGLCRLNNTYSAVCEFQESGMYTRLTVQDSAGVNECVLSKDESVTLALNGYRGDLRFFYPEDGAIEFTLLYSQGGRVIPINDLFDPVDIFDSAGSEPLNDTNNTHAFPFVEQILGGASSVRFNVGAIAGLPPTATTLSLRMTARLESIGNKLTLNVLGDESQGYPRQVRTFVAQSYQTDAVNDVVANVKTCIYLYPQSSSALAYPLLVDSVVAK